MHSVGTHGTASFVGAAAPFGWPPWKCRCCGAEWSNINLALIGWLVEHVVIVAVGVMVQLEGWHLHRRQTSFTIAEWLGLLCCVAEWSNINLAMIGWIVAHVVVGVGVIVQFEGILKLVKAVDPIISVIMTMRVIVRKLPASTRCHRRNR